MMRRVCVVKTMHSVCVIGRPEFVLSGADCKNAAVSMNVPQVRGLLPGYGYRGVFFVPFRVSFGWAIWPWGYFIALLDGFVRGIFGAVICRFGWS